MSITKYIMLSEVNVVLNSCSLCAFNCNVNRFENFGKCRCPALPKLALASIHNWEEPCISGTNGSGTVFFSGCNFSCVFCQNHEISHESFGKEISIERLSEIFLELQAKEVHNINLVSPTPYVYSIVEALKIAKEKGLHIPIVYNTNSYENIETIKLLNGYVDVYLPDLKYFDNETAIKFSKIPNYFEVATNTIKEMIKQVGSPILDENGIIKKGVIIRHLALPGHLTESKEILNWIKNNLSEDIYVSVMAQYFPTYKAAEYRDINRKLTKREYSFLLSFVKNIKNGYIQELSEYEEEYVPNFDLSGI